MAWMSLKTSDDVVIQGSYNVHFDIGRLSSYKACSERFVSVPTINSESDSGKCICSVLTVSEGLELIAVDIALGSKVVLFAANREFIFVIGVVTFNMLVMFVEFVVTEGLFASAVKEHLDLSLSAKKSVRRREDLSIFVLCRLLPNLVLGL